MKRINTKLYNLNIGIHYHTLIDIKHTCKICMFTYFGKGCGTNNCIRQNKQANEGTTSKLK